MIRSWLSQLSTGSCEAGFTGLPHGVLALPGPPGLPAATAAVPGASAARAAIAGVNMTSLRVG
ncbi:hypothetical protein GCM10009612_44510 [Streptomyces beijiangensis]